MADLSSGQPMIALVHEWLDSWGGAEYTLSVLHELFPAAPIFTSVYQPTVLPAFQEADIRTSLIQRLPFGVSKRRLYMPLMPFAFEQFDLRGFDIVISSSYGPAKGILTGPDQLHICYCHTPTRFLWEPQIDQRLPKGWLPQIIATNLRIWDCQAAQRPDIFLTNSKNSAARIAKYYRRSSTVIYPPVDTRRFQPVPTSKVEPYFLTASRLVTQKRLDLIIRAFLDVRAPLKIVGTGPEEAKLKKLAASAKNIEFLGFVPDDQLAGLMAHCQAFVFATEEDFGIVPVEAMSAGRPVIAYGQGGALESIIHGKTGVLFPEQTPQCLIGTIRDFRADQFDSNIIQKHAAQFDVSIFKKKIAQYIDEAWREKQAKQQK